MLADATRRNSSSIEDDIALLKAGKEPRWAPSPGKLRTSHSATLEAKVFPSAHSVPCTAGARGSDVGSLWPEPLVWPDLTDRDRQVYEIGFLTGFLMREDEVAQANSDADRYYRIAFDRTQRARRR